MRCIAKTLNASCLPYAVYCIRLMHKISCLAIHEGNRSRASPYDAMNVAGPAYIMRTDR